MHSVYFSIHQKESVLLVIKALMVQTQTALMNEKTAKK